MNITDQCDRLEEMCLQPGLSFVCSTVLVIFITKLPTMFPPQATFRHAEALPYMFANPNLDHCHAQPPIIPTAVAGQQRAVSIHNTASIRHQILQFPPQLYQKNQLLHNQYYTS